MAADDRATRFDDEIAEMRRQIYPLARRLANGGNIDLARVQGSGPHGRVVAKDIEEAKRGSQAGPSPASVAVGSHV